MRVAMTLFVRDEADIIDPLLRYHLHVGVDVFVVMDNGSTDGTTEILQSYETEGHVRLIREPRDVSQEDSVTTLARLAAVEHHADWVINSDADEFWWPREGSLKDMLGLVPAEHGVLHAPWWHFPPRPGDGWFPDRMTVRLCEPQPPRWHQGVKAAHRGDPNVIVAGGNHGAKLTSGTVHTRPLLDVLHYPYRSSEQFERKFIRWCSLLVHVDRLPPRYQEAWDAYQRGRLDWLYRSYLVSDRQLRRGTRRGIYVIDERVRDALATL
ncbi:MAG TPA: glycosyltransferase family 2 protein [Gaiellaceae bacterium]